MCKLPSFTSRKLLAARGVPGEQRLVAACVPSKP